MRDFNRSSGSREPRASLRAAGFLQLIAASLSPPDVALQFGRELRTAGRRVLFGGLEFQSGFIFFQEGAQIVGHIQQAIPLFVI